MLKHLKVIFVKFFIGISLVVFIVFSYAQYAITKKVDLVFLIPFSIAIAFIGAGFASSLIAMFRYVDDTPPRITASEYIQFSDSSIKEGLSAIRKKRLLLAILFLMWLPFGVALSLFNLPYQLAFIYMFYIAVVYFQLIKMKCPRCGFYFNFRSSSKGDSDWERANLYFGVGYRNFLTNKCLNCGLSVKR